MEELTAAGAIEPYPYQGFLLAPVLAAARALGRTDLVSMWSGQAAALLTHRHAGELYAALVHDTAAVLSTPAPEGATR
jgi:nitronate monooxygenase